ncbi:unnamed protein product [Coregonus sp. 'balchen']|nr:unnamed protein product [Coregonus sp. 'balchen']
MKETMDTVTRLVNFVRESSSLLHRRFRALLEEMSAEHKDLLLHNDVHWLSKGRVLERVCDLHDELHYEKHKMQEDPAMKDFVSRLAENFKERFESSPKRSADILLFVRQPFSVSADGQWIAEAKKLVPSTDEAALQMEILEMGTSDLLKAQHKDALVSDFWINVVPQARFKNTRDIAMLLLTMFPSTYICESAFSSMNAIKSQDRNRLSDSHLGQCLRIATTEYKPDIRKVASSRRSHFSH